MKPDISIVYSILRSWAEVGKPQTYSRLSLEYHSQTGEWYEPHGSWDSTLGELNQVLAVVNAPALSALVILKGANEPGTGFWGSAPNVPHRPKSELDRITEWTRVLDKVKSYQWPATLPNKQGQKEA